jgi:hypothetical protein
VRVWSPHLSCLPVCKLPTTAVTAKYMKWWEPSLFASELSRVHLYLYHQVALLQADDSFQLHPEMLGAFRVLDQGKVIQSRFWP